MTGLAPLLEAAVARERLVGAQLAVVRGGAVDVVAAGVADVRHGRPVTGRTRFEIGSVTKPLVAAALLLAQEQGLVDLDAPVAERVPELRPVDPRGAQVTARQLLSHTSGLAGDYFPDTGGGTDAVAAYVELLSQQPLDVPPGRTVSYSNGAYVLAGRLLERALGLPFDEALRAQVLVPAGGRELGTWNDPVDEHLAAGHALQERGSVEVSRRRYPRALSPAGGVVASAGALAEVVRSLTVAPVAPLPGWLPSRSRERLAPVATRPGTWLGWGWAVAEPGAGVLLAHDGGTYGSSSFVRVLPDSDLVLVLLTNRSGVGAAGPALLDEVLDALGHPPLATPTGTSAALGAVDEPSRLVGTYLRTGGTVQVDLHDGALRGVVSTSDEEAGTVRLEGPLSRQAPGSWLLEAPDGGVPIVFLGDGDEPADCAVVGVRGHTRVSRPPAPSRDAPR